jgi:hypothetical protein
MLMFAAGRSIPNQVATTRLVAGLELRVPGTRGF